MTTSQQDRDQILRDALASRGHRYTEQRAAVFHFLAVSRSHPTAEDVFVGVREDVPGISLATVYKSLEAIVGCGLAHKLSFGDGSARYDGNPDPHYHARCVGCDQIVDIHVDPRRGALESMVPGPTGFRVTDYHIELTGYCADCSSG
jgi:Fur family peroxide stress response transcriptional regulator